MNLRVWSCCWSLSTAGPRRLWRGSFFGNEVGRLFVKDFKDFRIASDGIRFFGRCKCVKIARSVIKQSRFIFGCNNVLLLVCQKSRIEGQKGGTVLRQVIQAGIGIDEGSLGVGGQI